MDFRLNQLKPGEKAVVTEIETEHSLRRRLMDIGLVENTAVECVGKSPMGDPAAYLIRGAVIAIRASDCSGIRIRKSG